jgi:branched-chain amino acid transport system ATP-binding protein
MLEISKVNTFYGKAQALWDVSLNIEKAEIVALIGANGAGKTTLLNTISGLITPASGNVKFLGKKIEGLAPNTIVEMGLSHVPEGRRLFSDMTVRENLEMGAYPSHAWKRKEDTFKQVYQIFPVLKEREGQLARTLSGGEQQMLAMGRGLMSLPKLCMFDEPSYGLAPRLMVEVFEVIKSLRKHGITILLIEQNVKNTLDIADRAYVLENGHVVLEGTCKQCLNNEHVKKAYLGL